MSEANEQKAAERQQVPHERVVSLRYSKKPPQEPGWYWQRDYHLGERCIQVHDFRGQMATEGFNALGGRGYFPITEKRDVYWAGPIPKPEAN